MIKLVTIFMFFITQLFGSLQQGLLVVLFIIYSIEFKL
jgi:hypothetical protein